MTEAEWTGADGPLGMLGWLCEGRHYLRQGPVSDRKLRLFACACCRAVWHLLRDKRSRRAVEASEQLADGRVPGGEAVRVWAAAEHGAPSGLAWQCTWPGAEECASDDKEAYLDAAGLPRNPVVKHLCMSGECLCGAFARPQELAEVARHYPRAAEYLRSLELRARAAGVHCVWGTRPPASPGAGPADPGQQHLCWSCEQKWG